MKKQLFLASFILFLSGMLAWIPVASAASDPVRMLQSIANQLISGLRANKAALKTNRSIAYSMAYKIVVPHADLDEMARRIVPPYAWNKATPAQRAEFKKQFTTVLVRTYASALSDYNDQTIRFYPVRGGYQGRVVRVDSQIIRTDGPSIPVSYKLVNRGGEWKIYDMTVEGVSLLESFRSQFSSSLNQNDISSLINSLRQHNARNR